MFMCIEKAILVYICTIHLSVGSLQPQSGENISVVMYVKPHDAALLSNPIIIVQLC